MLDIVINHTSTHHEWFKEAMRSKDSPYRDYYFFRESNDGPHVGSLNGGNAWQYDDKTDEYYLHLFDVSQADLNWDNPEVRRNYIKLLITGLISV